MKIRSRIRGIFRHRLTYEVTERQYRDSGGLQYYGGPEKVLEVFDTLAEAQKFIDSAEVDKYWQHLLGQLRSRFTQDEIRKFLKTKEGYDE